MEDINKKYKQNFSDDPLSEDNENWVSGSAKFKALIKNAGFYLKNPEKINELISNAYNKATHESGNKTVKEMWGKFQTLFRMLKAHFRKEYPGISTTKIIIGIAVILYFILPFDLLPDFIPLAGYLDDASLLGWFIRNSAEEIQKFQLWESEQSTTGVLV